MTPVISKLKFLLLNAENLFLLSDQKLSAEHLNLDETSWSRLSTSVYNNKPLNKAKALAEIILTQDPDIIMLCEVGGLESLQNFNQLFLGDKYSSVLQEGNSKRNIDVGFLIRRGVPYYFDLISNKNRAINYLYPHERQSLDNAYPAPSLKGQQSHKFSRDVAELHLFQKDREKPFLICLLTHLKSRLDPENIDPGGSERRHAELKTMMEIYRELEVKYEGKVPIAVAGDFNGNASSTNTDAEFAELYQTELKDVCHLANLDAPSSATYYQISKNTKADAKQLDYCFLSPKLAQYLEAESVKVLRYPGHPPTTLDAKMALPSDHYPLVFDIKNLPLF
jgi:exonuclease III